MAERSPPTIAILYMIALFGMAGGIMFQLIGPLPGFIFTLLLPTYFTILYLWSGRD